MFASAGEDGSVRHFDLRDLEHSTIIFESPEQTPLLRVAQNKIDANYLATIMMDKNQIVILDIRVPMLPVAELKGHKAPVNSICWAPHSWYVYEHLTFTIAYISVQLEMTHKL